MEKSLQKVLKAMLYSLFFVLLLLTIYLNRHLANNEQRFSIFMKVIFAGMIILHVIECILNYRKERQKELVADAYNLPDLIN